jgi:hypothetical protein
MQCPNLKKGKFEMEKIPFAKLVLKVFICVMMTFKKRKLSSAARKIPTSILRNPRMRVNFRDTSTRVRARVMMMEAVGEVQRGTTELAEKIREILFV